MILDYVHQLGHMRPWLHGQIPTSIGTYVLTNLGPASLSFSGNLETGVNEAPPPLLRFRTDLPDGDERVEYVSSMRP